jgi:hypothetical protein
MRELVDASRLRGFMRALGDEVRVRCRVCLAGGATAVLIGWRPTTAKIERGHAQDRLDVEAMLSRGLATAAALRERFGRAEPLLYRFPALHPASFRRALEDAVGRAG